MNKESDMKGKDHNRRPTMTELNKMTMEELIAVMRRNDQLIKEAKRKCARQDRILHELAVDMFCQAHTTSKSVPKSKD